MQKYKTQEDWVLFHLRWVYLTALFSKGADHFHSDISSRHFWQDVSGLEHNQRLPILWGFLKLCFVGKKKKKRMLCISVVWIEQNRRSHRRDELQCYGHLSGDDIALAAGESQSCARLPGTHNSFMPNTQPCNLKFPQWRTHIQYFKNELKRHPGSSKAAYRGAVSYNVIPKLELIRKALGSGGTGEAHNYVLLPFFKASWLWDGIRSTNPT